jgi:hypothetical protein
MVFLFGVLALSRRLQPPGSLTLPQVAATLAATLVGLDTFNPRANG